MAEKSTTNSGGTLIGQSLVFDRYASNPLIRLLLVIFWIAGFLSILYIVVSIFGPASLSQLAESSLDEEDMRERYLGLSSLVAGLFIYYLPLRAFYLEKLKYPKVVPLLEAKGKLTKGETVNYFSLFSFDLAKSTRGIFSNSKKTNTTKDLAHALLGSKSIDFLLFRLGVGHDAIESLLNDYAGVETVPEVLRQALEVAVAEEHHQIEVGDVLVALAKVDPLFAKLIEDLKLTVADLAHVVYWQTSLIRKSLEGHRFLDPKRFRFTGGIGRDWAYGYTPMLDQFGHDLTASIQTRGLGIEIIGREKEIKEIAEALMRQNSGNAILVGEAGVGKRTTVLGLAKQIADGNIGDHLAYKHLIEVNLESLIATYQGEAAANAINSLFAEIISAGNIIVFIENIQNLLSNESAGSINAIELLLPFLDYPDMNIVATSDVATFNGLVASNTALAERFTRVTVDESGRAETIRILEDVVPAIEARAKVVISYEAIKETVVAADKYILSVPNPEKSINLLDGSATRAASERGRTIVLPKDIKEYVTDKYDVPASEAGQDEKDKLLHLEEEMHKRVVGQAEAVKAIANALKRVRAGVVNSKKPIGSFLFLGPTGVGKTETAKALAASYFGDEGRMIRFDMSEYQNKEDIYRFIGSNISGEDVQGTLTVAVREHPFSLLLFDEIEKAHRDILDLFLQVLDEGHLTDGFGRKVAFTNTIIICTSNAGSNLIRQSINSGTDYGKVKETLIEYLQQENIYRPEFLNRFTQIVAFSPLSPAEINSIAGLMISNLQNTVRENKGIEVEIAPETVAELAKMGFDPKMGARPMQRVIQEKVEDYLANQILSGKAKKGDKIMIGIRDIV
ncbi:MAG: ATP-dependent Clp protease ATP-binding subunit [Patescibacteria group bacterium]|jgi:ATP-dependent Clp protease ATP-binding subunit ClpC